MIRLIFLLSLVTNLSFAQTDTDYQLYSQVINDFVNEGIKYNEKTTQVVIITKYFPDDNKVSAYGQEFIDSDEQTISMSLHYDTMKIRLFKEAHVKEAIKILEKEFSDTPTLDKSKFNLNPIIISITNKQFKGYFGRQIWKGWKKFYKKYPGSHGVFEFSKIVYNDNYACFYVGRHSNSLSGSGDLVICKKQNGDWRIVTFVNIWMS